jgi:hypothetical protein
VDLLTNNIVDVTANGTEYSFIAANTSEPVIRFKIITQATGLDSPEVNTMLKVVHLESAFVIQNSSNLSGSVKLFNLSGEIVSQKDFGSNGTTSLSTSGLSSGTYIMKAMTMNEKIIKKFIIR